VRRRRAAGEGVDIIRKENLKERLNVKERLKEEERAEEEDDRLK
tara:strand:+ start:88 stop:219 length:132 start_codon:yes stop_codon:yes gene_type:complete